MKKLLEETFDHEDHSTASNRVGKNNIALCTVFFQLTLVRKTRRKFTTSFSLLHIHCQCIGRKKGSLPIGCSMGMKIIYNTTQQ